MALDLQSLSLTSAFSSIVGYFRSQENNSKWYDLSVGSEGSFLCRMLANVMSTISYRIVAQSRENYLSTAALTSSNVGIAVNLGYSVFRGSNLKRLVYLVPNGNYTLPKFSVIGSYSTIGEDYSILTLDDVELIEGQVAKIRTVVGNLKEESFIVGTSDVKIFSLFTTGISEDFILFKDSEEVPTTRNMKGLTEDKYLVRTNPYSSVDIAYLNNKDDAKYKYGTGTEITIRYVELADVPVVPYVNNMFTYGTLQDYATISLNLPFETVDSIKVTAPLDHETQNLIRSKVDYANRLRDPDVTPDVSEVNFNALTPTYTQVTYLKDNFTLLTGSKVYAGSAQQNEERLSNTEVEKVTEVLKDENFFGTPLPDITVPRREVADLQISLALTNKYKSVADINLDIDNILKNYYNSYLAVTFSTYELERLIENLSYVKYARVSFAINERKTGTNYQLGYVIYNKDTKNYYKVTKILGYTGESEPADGWTNVPVNPGKEIDTKAVVRDGTIYWRCFKRLPSMPKLSISRRQPSAQYGIGDFMYLDQYPDYMFKCVDIVRESGGNPPDLTNAQLKDFITDGSIIWVVRDRISEAPSWESMHQYQLGDVVNLGVDYSLECISYMGSTGTLEDLTFEQYEYPVVGVNEAKTQFFVEGDQRFYFRVGDAIQANYSSGATAFVVTACTYPRVDNTDPENPVTLDETAITVARYEEGTGDIIDTSKNYTSLITVERGTKDGGVLWSLVDNIDKVDYNWNSFVTFTHTLTILEE